MLEFPVNVTQSNTGDYIAQLADFPEGPEGRGVDPYAALEDLSSNARDALSALQNDGKLPTPSPIDDRPVVTFDSSTATLTSPAQEPLATGKGDQSEMIGYTWTNHTVFIDNLGSSK